LKTFIVNGYGDDLMMCCPQCGWTAIHPITVSVLRGTDETTINSASITVKEAENNGKGVQIAMEYACENGHHGHIIFDFCEGETLISHQILKSFEVLDFKTIWRN
jgi:hypothetical protein